MESKREFYIPLGVSRSAHVQTMLCGETNGHVTRYHGLNSVEPSVLITLLRVARSIKLHDQGVELASHVMMTNSHVYEHAHIGNHGYQITDA